MQLLHGKASKLNKKIDPTIPGIKQSNLQKEKKNFFQEQLLLDQRSFLEPAISSSFFCTPVNNLGNMLFQVLSIDKLGELSFELSLLKVQGREVALSELI